MHNIRSIIPLSLLCLCLSSCTNDKSSSDLELNSPITTRMDAAVYNSVEYRVDIIVNSEAVQSYSVDPTEATVPVIISGVRVNELNSIEVIWYAIVDDISVELSRQSQEFIADGNTIIDAPHNQDEYDFDGDGASNLFELAAGSCIWSNINTDPCIYPEPTNNILLNGDFIDGTEQWWKKNATRVESDGENCVISQAIAINPSNSQVGYLHQLFLEPNSSYTLSFDARAEPVSTVSVGIALPGNNTEVVFTESVELFSTYEPSSYTFETANQDYDQSQLTFNIGTGAEISYCFDNVVLEKVVDL